MSSSPAEAGRLAALESYAILDTPNEQVFDDIAQLARHICNTPMALVSFVAETKQWFKAHPGLEAAETPRSMSFCAHAIQQPHELFVVNDALNDPRFAQNPLVLGDPNIRFYAGAPLLTDDGWPLGTLCVIDHHPRDLTDSERLALQVLRRHVLDALELRRVITRQKTLIARLTATESELQSAKTRADAASLSKSQFLATMSHEFRTPLNAIIGISHLLAGTGSTDEQRDYLQSLQNSGEHLLGLVNDVLDLAKIEAGKFDFVQAPLDVRAQVERALQTNAPAATAKGLRLTAVIDPAVPAAVLGDETRLRQILVNLIANGVKFTSKGGIQVHVSATASADNTVDLVFSVVDSGMGIPAEKLPRLFAAFTQADATTALKFGGTGLGLSISKHLVEAQGGSISAESVAGQGSTFRFVLPRLAVCVPAAPRVQAGSMFDAELATRHPHRILVADDNLVNRKVMAGMLRRFGYDTALATNGQEAVDATVAGEYDLVFMDIDMPLLDGTEATRLIRSRATAGVRPWIVALTAHALVGDRPRFFEAGMDDALTKPIDPTRLRAVLAAAPALVIA